MAYRQVTIIPHRYWLHTSGRKASVYGACPWGSETDKPNWTRREAGFTWECVDSRGTVTIGSGRVPATSYVEAERIREQLLTPLS